MEFEAQEIYLNILHDLEILNRLWGSTICLILLGCDMTSHANDGTSGL
jgi:hypothetical protein